MKLLGISRDETLDALFQGKVSIIQRMGGYRFSLDAVLLARFLEIKGGEEIVDLGTGNGVIPLILASLYSSVRVVGLEVQVEMVKRALRSVDLNRLKDRVEVVEGDVCSIERLFSHQSFDAAVAIRPTGNRKAGGSTLIQKDALPGMKPRAASGIFSVRGSICCGAKEGWPWSIRPCARWISLKQ